MPLISVITAVYGPTAKYIAETMVSIKSQALPEGWELEWVVQEDGPNPSLGDELRAVENVRYDANGAQLGIALTRNLALSRASGALIQALDADDLLLPGALETLIPTFTDQIHWAIGQADDLLPDGSRKAYESAIPFGVLPAGSVNTWAVEHGGNWPIHGAALLMRATSLRALGGWTGIPYDDELATFAALSEIADGYHHSALTWLYRHHAEQTHRTDASRSRSAACRRIALQRAQAVRVAGMDFTCSFLDLEGDQSSITNVEVGPALKEEQSA